MKAIRVVRCSTLAVILFLAALPAPASSTMVVSESFDTEPEPDWWTLRGSASWNSELGGIVLTALSPSQTGSLFWNWKFDGWLWATFEFWIGGGTGGEGFTFAWVNGGDFLGQGGSSLGFGGLEGYAIRFDTNSNREGEPANYIALTRSTPEGPEDLIVNSDIPELQDVVDAEGNPAPFRVEIVKQDNHLLMWLSNPTAATPILEMTVLDFEIPDYQSLPAFVGFTAATSSLYNIHFVDDVEIAEPSWYPPRYVAYPGDVVTLAAAAGEDVIRYTWTQIAGEPTVTLDDPNPPTGISHFIAPHVDIPTILTFELTVELPDRTESDTLDVTILPKSPPVKPPSNLRALPLHLGFILEWDPLLDADEYIVEARLSPGEWPPPTYTACPWWLFQNLVEGQVYEVRVTARNQFGDGQPSEVLSFAAMRNLALPATLGGTTPPSDYVYTISHFNIADMNNGELVDDNHSWDEFYKEEDYWGYLWPGPVTMDHVVYFTGDMLWDGGWFTDLNVQYTKDGTTWVNVPTDITPEYDFTNQREGKEAYARYGMRIPVLRGKGVRISGTPGGVSTFTSIAELEVYGDEVTPRPLVVQGIDGEIAEGGTATLDGSFSFSTRGDLVSYEWEQLSGPEVTIKDDTSAVASFEAPGVDGDTVFVFRLTASDGTETLSDDYVCITIVDLSTPPMEPLDQSVVEGTPVVLDGSSWYWSKTTTYLWTQIAGTPVTLNNPDSVVCTFTAHYIWGFTENLIFELRADDGLGQPDSIHTCEVLVEVRHSLAWPNWKYTDAMAAGTGYMTDLLHLGNNPTDRILSPLDINKDPLEKFGGQAFVNPVPDEVYNFTATGVVTTRPLMTWTPVHNSIGFFAYESLNSFQQIYHIYVISPDEQPARFHFRHDERLRIWNNGELVVSRDTWDGGEEQTEDFVLDDGLNSMTIKFEEQAGSNYLAVGITDRSDQPFDDLYCSFGPSFVLTDAYVVRELPESYQPGGTVDVSLSLRVNPDETLSDVTISEVIPAGLTVVDVGGGVVVGGSINWTFSGGAVATQMLSYTLGVPVDTSGTLDFRGTVAFDDTVEEIEGDDVIYPIPGPQKGLQIDGLAVPRLKWNTGDLEGVVGYNIYRSMDGGLWEKIAYVTDTAYVDEAVVLGKTYCYTVAPVNAAGVEGPWTSEVVCWPLPLPVEIQEAEDYDEAFYHDIGGPPPWPHWWGEYRPPYHPDDPHIMPIPDEEDEWVIGYTSPGDWWTYDFQIPEAGWVKIELRVGSPSGGRIEVYWDQVLFGNVEFVTGNWFVLEYVPVEDQVWSKSGVHTLKVKFVSGQLAFDKFVIGLNWQGPIRETIFADDFESYETLYTNDEVVDTGWTVINGSGESAVAWRLWNTAGELLKTEDPALHLMTGNYMIADSDFSETAVMDEHLITPEIDCGGHRNLRLDFSINHRVYPDDTDYLQIAEVDVHARDAETGAWGEWINFLRLDTSVVADNYFGLERIDLSDYDGRKIQVRWHFYDAVWDYWLAIDEVRISGEKEQQKEKLIRQIGVFEGKLGLTWDAFGDGNYTVEYTHDLAAGNWQPVPGFTWPTLDTTWPGESIASVGNRFYRVRSE